MNLNDLGAKLPELTITWRGFGQPTLIDLNRLTGDEVTPESPCLEPVVKLLEGLFQLQQTMNAERMEQDKPALHVIARTVEVSANNNPMYVYTLNVEINAQAALNNLVDPTEEA